MRCNSAIVWKAPLTRLPPPVYVFAHGSQTALIWRAVGAANDLRNTRCPISRNGFDFADVLRKSHWQLQNDGVIFARQRKVLNLRAESKRRQAVIKVAFA